MEYTIWQFVFFFFLYSVLGWLSEVSYAALETGELVNRGFLNGPLCPIYGSGMMAMLLCLGPWADNVLVVFFGGMAITTLIELVGGIFLYRVFHTRWWDYSDFRFNFGGYICLKFSILWGFGSILLLMVFHPILAGLVLRIPALPLMIVDIVMLVLFAADFVVSVAGAIGLNQRLTQLDEIRSAMRIGSDKISQVVGQNVITADEMLDQQKLQLALAKLEGKENAAQLRAELTARYDTMTAKYKEIMSGLDHTSHLGAGRLLRAFPDMKSRDHADSVAQLMRDRTRKLAASAKKAITGKKGS